MLEYKIVVALIAATLEVIANFPYIRDILAKKDQTTLFYMAYLDPAYMD
jgi:hypothetical protein